MLFDYKVFSTTDVDGQRIQFVVNEETTMEQLYCHVKQYISGNDAFELSLQHQEMVPMEGKVVDWIKGPSLFTVKSK